MAMSPGNLSVLVQGLKSSAYKVGIHIWENRVRTVFCLCTIAGLYVVYLLDSYFFNAFADIFTVAVSIAIFLLVWKSRKVISNNFLVLMGIIFFIVALLDCIQAPFWHGEISPQGIPDDLFLTISVINRYILAVSILAAPLLIHKRVSRTTAIIYLTVDAVVVAMVFLLHVFPEAYLDESGLTPIVISSEFAQTIILAGSLILLYRNRNAFDRSVFNNFVFAIMLSISAGLALITSDPFLGVSIFIVHIFMLGSLYFFYIALVEIGQEKPYDLLYRDLKESEKKYHALIDLTPDAVIVRNTGRILFMNPAALRLFGSTAVEDPAEPDCLAYTNPPDLEMCLGEVSQGSGPVRDPLSKELEFTIDGRRVYIESIRSPVIWEGKDGMLEVLRDISIRKKFEEDLLNKNEALNTAYSDLAAIRHELERKVEELRNNEVDLQKREEELRGALEEKETLLSEVHHRVKNNLAAFISLLSLDDAYEDTPAGQALKKDLLNRARSMALIHETLYRTQTYSRVDMNLYLDTLVDQIAMSYLRTFPIKTVVRAPVSLDLARATPCGLIINELVTNSLKYAFPPVFVARCTKEGTACTVHVSLTLDNGIYTLIVADNGEGLPSGFDIKGAPTLGLRLVSFLARHQLNASIEVNGDRGAEFILRFSEFSGSKVSATPAGEQSLL
jgi:PAS domain S-box-containing protein